MNVSTSESADRTWSATITYANGETVEATLSVGDLKEEMMATAYLEATEFLLAGAADGAFVQLYKTTKAHGRVKDWSSSSLDVDGAVRYARRVVEWRQNGWHRTLLPAPPKW